MSRLVTSLTNPTVKSVRGLHLRKEREQSGLFVAEGLKIVTEAVELGHAPRILMYGKDASYVDRMTSIVRIATPAP